jgi:hypothetical protein
MDEEVIDNTDTGMVNETPIVVDQWDDNKQHTEQMF